MRDSGVVPDVRVAKRSVQFTQYAFFGRLYPRCQDDGGTGVSEHAPTSQLFLATPNVSWVAFVN
jgi:hypothetical protein